MGQIKNLIIEILELHAHGLTTTEISDRLGLALITVTNVINEYSYLEG
jgi:orotate phosphoribosyltransferase-like protein